MRWISCDFICSSGVLENSERGNLALILALALLLGGCASGKSPRREVVRYDTARTYEAPFDAVWLAVKHALKDYRIVIAYRDEAKREGRFVSDWVQGESDIYTYQDEKGVTHPCRCEYSIEVTVKGQKGGDTRVEVKIYERTELMTLKGFKWRRTNTSTQREKHILDAVQNYLTRHT